VRGQHDRSSVGGVRDVVDEYHAERLEPVDDHLVVDDLVVAVDRRLERADHPRERLDRHLDAGAEAPGRGQEHTVDVHLVEATDEDPPVAWPPWPFLESSRSRPGRRRRVQASDRATRCCG
jgi:hypothetical protein